MDPYFYYIVGSGLLATGGAWGAVKVTLNGTKDRVKKLEESQTDNIDRLARIETKIDRLMERQ